jgi:hypothetical protein
VLSQQVSETVVLLDPEDGHYYTLSGVGGRIWQLCDGSLTVEQLIDRIGTEYDGDPRAVAADLTCFLADLANERLVVGAR